MLLYSPLLAQVNVGSPQAVFLGLMIASSGAGLYFLRSFRPELARDHDIFFAAIALLCGGIVFFNGWRLDPILLFSQILLGGSAIFFAVESIRLRGIATDQARRNTPIVDDDRPVGRVYRAELDELSPSDQVPSVRRIRSARDSSAEDEDIYARERVGESRSGRRPRRSRPS
ncbi:MAG: Ycf66 family protein, partial [Cyanobacteria bacterium P01_A01_bin.17]